MSIEAEDLDCIAEGLAEWREAHPNGNDDKYNVEDLVEEEIRQNELDRQQDRGSIIFVVYSEPSNADVTLMRAFEKMWDAEEYVKEKKSDPMEPDNYKTQYIPLDME